MILCWPPVKLILLKSLWNFHSNRSGQDIEWKGKNEHEVGKDAKTGTVLIEVDKSYYRPTEVDLLIGDPSKAKKVLGWETKVTFEELVKIMVQADCEMVQKKGY